MWLALAILITTWLENYFWSHDQMNIFGKDSEIFSLSIYKIILTVSLYNNYLSLKKPEINTFIQGC